LVSAEQNKPQSFTFDGIEFEIEREWREASDLSMAKCR
jgi:hypothetical protein